MITMISKSSPPQQGKFVLVVGIGHCGTKWISQALDHPDEGIKFYHENKLAVTGLGWKETLSHELDELDERFDSYWDWINTERVQYEVVGDSNSWHPFVVPKVASKTKIDHVIYLVRNGIQNVHSAFYHNIDIPGDDWLYTRFFKFYREFRPRVNLNVNTYTPFIQWCFVWRANQFMPQWLAERIGKEKVMVCRFEDLLEDCGLLQRLLTKLNPSSNIEVDKLMLAQKTDVNRKIEGDRAPENLWAKWSYEQREIFEKICGHAMSHYRYQIPKS